MTGQPRLLLVTGMSGAGKSTVLDALEDMGWDCVDNLPVALLADFIHGERKTGQLVPAAVGMDSRSRGFDANRLPDIVRAIEGVTPEILYLDCSDVELSRRYNATRRRHPLARDRTAEDGIARDRRVTAALRQTADSVLDTTDLTPAELRDELRIRYGEDRDHPVITVTSFGYSRGMSRTADLVFDMRFVPNPHWIDALRPLTGTDKAVQDYCAADPGWAQSMATIESLLSDLIPRYWAAGKSYLTVAFGCTGGRHRSVAAALEMAERLRVAGFPANIRHRDLSSQPSDSVEDTRPDGTASEPGE
ncbi:RNase adapter RapZ [Sphingomonas sp.]|uniref:RNase adapter RapZ n=1 Tax=Sphingomonas sp. TaxID=28214 RepID=UPI002869F634|nr:RNase adapter RapZ [Sphingomonas sp.]